MCGPFSDFYAFQMGLNYHIFILAFKKFAHHYENYFIMTNGRLFLKKMGKRRLQLLTLRYNAYSFCIVLISEQVLLQQNAENMKKAFCLMFWRMCVKNYKSENYDLTKEDQYSLFSHTIKIHFINV